MAQPISPAEAYGSRLAALQLNAQSLRVRDRRFIVAKLATGLVTVVLAAWFAKDHPERLAILLIPVALLIALFIVHERILKSMRDNTTLSALYKHGTARLEDRWQHHINGETGDRYLREAMGGLAHPAQDHPYARDLDLFGPGSLYHLLCTAHTRIGQDTLGAWLLAPASVSEVHPRQLAIRELAPMLAFREQLALAAAEFQQRSDRTGRPATSFADWSESASALDANLRLPAFFVATAWLAVIVLWQVGLELHWSGYWLLAALVGSLVTRQFGARHRDRLAQSIAAIQAATSDLHILANVLRTIEKQAFTSEKLVALHQPLRATGKLPSDAIGNLASRVDWLASADNWFVKILDRFIHWRLQSVLLVEAWRRHHGASVRTWLQSIGEIEALTALATFAYENPGYIFPSFTGDSPLLDAIELAHPLLPRSRAVPNTLRLDRQLQLIVVSGPNMAGKSTFIRSIGINVVLAQAGAPVRAASMTLSPLNVAASICILDSLQGGLSRFYAEIVRLKHIDTLSRQPTPVLFLLDELLSGTNSHDRRAGTESMVRGLVARGAIGLVTTHDLALAAIAESMSSHAANFHFEDRFEDGRLSFDYKLTPGIVQTSNALQLMRAIGLEV